MSEHRALAETEREDRQKVGGAIMHAYHECGCSVEPGCDLGNPLKRYEALEKRVAALETAPPFRRTKETEEPMSSTIEHPELTPQRFYLICERREDGGLRVTCPEVPGLILSHADPHAVMRDVIRAIDQIERHDRAALRK